MTVLRLSTVGDLITTSLQDPRTAAEIARPRPHKAVLMVRTASPVPRLFTGRKIVLKPRTIETSRHCTAVRPSRCGRGSVAEARGENLTPDVRAGAGILSPNVTSLMERALRLLGTAGERRGRMLGGFVDSLLQMFENC